MARFLASNITLECLQNGADVLSDDDTYIKINGGKYGFGHLTVSGSPGLVHDSRIGAKEMRTGDNAHLETARVTLGVVLPPEYTFQDGLVSFDNAVSFSVYDADTGPFEGGDDFIGATSYVPNGTEPLAGQGAYHFVNFMKNNGSIYRLEYDINKVNTTTAFGKFASKDGGLMNGSNKSGTLVGLNGKDIINANNGDDLLDGGANSDILNGGNSDDLIFGGKGRANDVLSGGTGKDLFVIGRNIGLDTIKDFRSEQDTIGLGNGLKFEDLSVWNRSGGTVVKAGNQQIAFLQGTNANSLSASDFSQMDIGSLNSLVKHDLAALKG